MSCLSGRVSNAMAGFEEISDIPAAPAPTTSTLFLFWPSMVLLMLKRVCDP